MEESLQKVLQQVFGYKQFRHQQADIIQELIAGNDVFVLMPTGGGKSLCYQIPALIRKGTAIVISPLIALMQNQVEALRELNVSAAYLNSSLSKDEAYDIENDLLEGKLDLLYVAPERLLMPNFLQLLTKIDIALFAIDEAHCVSQWGHDFRPEYVQLSILHEQFKNVPRIALTATADEPTRREIIQQLELAKAKHFISSFDRPNIQYRVLAKQNPKDQLLQFMLEEHENDAGIIYCLSRKKSEETAEWLREKKILAYAYHAGLSNALRQKVLREFLQEEGIVIVATVAFGMGIDKPNVRFVAHLDLPKSLEAYYQETGRAGRDGLPSNAFLLYGMRDVVLLRQMIDGGEGDDQHKILERRKLDALIGYCESSVCRREVLLHYFHEKYQGPCGYCDNCLQPKDTFDGKIAAQMAISCVYRTGQRFGVKHLIDVLCGKITKQVERFAHDKISTFAIGTLHTPSEWQSIYRQLVAANFLTIDMNAFGSVRFTEKSLPFLRGEYKIALRKEAKKADKKEKKSSKKANLTQPQDAFWQALKDKRLTLARKQNVPPYIIFHDSSLLEIYHKRPRTRDEFASISGVGEQKLLKYADEFLQVVISTAS